MSGTADEGFAAHPSPRSRGPPWLAAQERSLGLAQAWSGSLQRLISDQAEGGRAAPSGPDLDPGRDRAGPGQPGGGQLGPAPEPRGLQAVIERATATQERSTRLVMTALESFTATTQAQLELTRAFLAPLSAQPEAFGSIVQGLERRLPAAARGGAGRQAEAGQAGLRLSLAGRPAWRRDAELLRAAWTTTGATTLSPRNRSQEKPSPATAVTAA